MQVRRAVSYRLSAVSCQISAVGSWLSGISRQRSAFSGTLSVWAFLVLSLGVVGGGLEAGDAALEIKAPNHAVTVGDRLSVRVHARGGEGSLWGDLAFLPDEEELWAVVEGPKEIPGANPPVWEVVLVPLDVGDLQLPGIEASLRDTEGVAVNIAPNERPVIKVASVLAPEDEGQPAPLRAPIGVEGFPWEWVAPIFVLSLPLVVLAALLWRSRRRALAALEDGSPRLAPFDELERLLREVQDSIARQPAEVVCDRLSFGIRNYLERRTGDPAAEMTSNELRNLARGSGWPQDVQVDLQRVTSVVDGVRFGRKQVTSSELEAAGRSAHFVGKQLEVFLVPDSDEVGL